MRQGVNSPGVSMTRVGRRRANMRLDGRGEVHTTPENPTPTNIPDRPIPPRLAELQGRAAEHGAATCSSCGTQHGGRPSCAPGSGVPATGRYR